MRLYKDLTPRQQFFRKNIARLVIYGSFVATVYWSVTEVIEIKQEREIQKGKAQKAYIEERIK